MRDDGTHLSDDRTLHALAPLMREESCAQEHRERRALGDKTRLHDLRTPSDDPIQPQPPRAHLLGQRLVRVLRDEVEAAEQRGGPPADDEAVLVPRGQVLHLVRDAEAPPPRLRPRLLPVELFFAGIGPGQRASVSSNRCEQGNVPVLALVPQPGVLGRDDERRDDDEDDPERLQRRREGPVVRRAPLEIVRRRACDGCATQKALDPAPGRRALLFVGLLLRDDLFRTIR